MARANILEVWGYKVISAVDGREAVALWENGIASGIDLVFTDLVMPGISGLEMLNRLRSLGYSGPCLTSSGYPDQAEELSRRLADGEVCFLQKPYSPIRVLEEIARILVESRLPDPEAR